MRLAHAMSRSLLALALSGAGVAPASAVTPGTGYVPPPGSQSCFYTRYPTNPADPPRLVCAPMDLGARPFPFDAARFRSRYGYVNDGTPPCETKTCHPSADHAHGLLGWASLRAMCRRNDFGTAASHDCNPTLLEHRDFAATHPDNAWYRLVPEGGGETPPPPRRPAAPGATSSPPCCQTQF